MFGFGFQEGEMTARAPPLERPFQACSDFVAGIEHKVRAR